MVNAGYRAIDSLSAEKGYRHWHADLRPDDTPLESGLGFTCKLKTDIPFLGREALEKQKKEGIKKKLITITLNDTDVPLWGLEGILRNGKVVGYVRRTDYAFALGRAIAYGYVTNPSGESVKKSFLESGNWQIETMGTHYDATVHTKQPFDPKNMRIKGVYEDLEPVEVLEAAI